MMLARIHGGWERFADSRLIVLLIYVACAGVFASGLIAEGNQALVGDDQAGLSFWTTWWFPHAIQRNYDVVYNNYAVFPVENNYLSLLSLPGSLIYLLFRSIFGQALAYNLLVPLYSALSAFVSYCFLRSCSNKADNHILQRNRALAFIGGWIIAFNPVTFTMTSRSEVALLGFWVIPLWLILWNRFMARPTTPNALLLAGGLYLVVVMNIQHWGLIATVLIPYAAFDLYEYEKREFLIQRLIPGILVFALFFLIYPATPFLWSTYLPFYAPLEVWQGRIMPSSFLWQLFIGLGLLIFFIILWRAANTSDRKVRFHGFWVGFSALWVLFPGWSPLSIIGNLFSAPHFMDLTHSNLFFSGLLLVGSCSVIELCPAHADRVCGMIRDGRVMIGALIAVVILSGWWQPLPSFKLTYYTIYEAIANDPEDYVVAHFPLGADTLARRHYERLPQREIADERAAKLRLQEIQARYDRSGFFHESATIMASIPLHGKRVLGGMAPANLPDSLAIYEQRPLLRLLGAETVTGEVDESIATIRNDVARWRIGYIFLRRDRAENYLVADMRAWLTASGAFCFIQQEENTEVWRARWHPEGCPAQKIDLGSGDAGLMLDDHWYSSEDWGDMLARWAGKDKISRVSLWARPVGDYLLRIRLSSPQIAGQVVAVRVNGDYLGNFELDSDWRIIEVTVPRLLIRNERVLVELRHDSIQNIEGRALTAVYDWIELEALEGE